ncbi:MAG: putative lipid II flippase FtsW [Patescibacteria group bacterium]|jgi:cell division protein FtsW
MRKFNFRKKSYLAKFIKPKKQITGRSDIFLLTLIFIIAAFGLIMLSSASSVVSFQQKGYTYYFFWHQVSRGIVPGLILFFILSKIDYQRWEKYTVGFFVLSIILLISVFIPGLGASYGKAKSWLNFAGLSIQPTEIFKLLLILSLAGWFSYRGREKNADFWNGLVPFSVLLGLVSLLIVLEPDLGTLLVIITIAFAVYFVAGARFTHILGLMTLGLGAFGILMTQMPTKVARLMTFLHPELDPQGVGYHINQALLAIGSGGWFGFGFGQSRQKFAYLPEVMGDSIFAIIAEELGFIFATALIILFLLLAWRGFKLAQGIEDDYGRFIVVGIISWFTFQAFLNIGAMVGLLPLTGIPLPFVSYGGTALAVSLAASGILINISKTSK